MLGLIAFLIQKKDLTEYLIKRRLEHPEELLSHTEEIDYLCVQ